MSLSVFYSILVLGIFVGAVRTAKGHLLSGVITVLGVALVDTLMYMCTTTINNLIGRIML